MMTTKRICLTLCLLSLSCSAVCATAYSIREVGWAGTTARAWDVNNQGQVVGHDYALGQAFLWTDGQVQYVAAPPGTAHAVNNVGHVVGYSSGRAFLWESGVTYDLGTLPSRQTSAASDINDNSQIVGASELDGPTNQHAFLWEGGVMRDLGTLGGSYSRATAINNSGQVVGDSAFSSGSYLQHAFLWENGVMRDLGTLGDGSWAYGINNHSQVVGMSWISASQTSLGFLWENGVMRSLGAGSAYGINDAGDIVGELLLPSGPTAVMWHDGQRVELATLLAPSSGWRPYSARAINDAGQIVGWGLYNGRDTSFLMTPIPEPSALAGLGLALAGLAVFRRR